MCNVPVFVGLDYHQDAVQVCVLSADGSAQANRSVGNDSARVADVVRRYGQPVRIAIEACCGAADMAEELILRQGLPVELAHPGYVARLKRSLHKTDLGDAQLLADLTTCQPCGWRRNRRGSLPPTSQKPKWARATTQRSDRGREPPTKHLTSNQPS